MKQTRKMSLVESLANVALGYGISVLANIVVLPAFGFPVSTREAALMGLVFTVISLVRSFALRRLFEALR
jgi:hypothetical protein